VPITTLGRITGLDPQALGAMVGRQTPILALFVPLILVLMVDGHRGVRQTWPAALVGGAAFAVAQFVSSNYLAYQTADIVAAFAGAIALVVLLRVWQPAEVVAAEVAPAPVRTGGGTVVEEQVAEPLTAQRTLLAFAPYLVVVVLFTLASFGPLQAFLDAHSGWKFAWPGLEVLSSTGKPPSATTFNLNIVNAGGTVLLVSGLITAAIYRLHPRRLVRAFVDVVVQFRWTILTVVLVLALAYVMNLSGQTVTLGLALAATGGFFAFLSPVVGWIGVAVTGSDTSANSLFGLLQTTAAARTGISPVLLGAANTSGGVLGKMISPQNLAIGAAVVGMTGQESELFRKVVGWSVGLLLGMALLVFLQSTPVLGWMVVAP